jgi:hypothetical protein
MTTREGGESHAGGGQQLFSFASWKLELAEREKESHETVAWLK